MKPTQLAPAEAEPSTMASAQSGFMSTAQTNDAYRVVNKKNKFYAFVGALKQVDNKGNVTLYFHHIAYTKKFKSVDIEHVYVNSIGTFDLKSMVQLASPKGKCDLGVFKECAGQTANVINVGEGKVSLHFECGRVIEFSMSQHLKLLKHFKFCPQVSDNTSKSNNKDNSKGKTLSRETQKSTKASVPIATKRNNAELVEPSAEIMDSGANRLMCCHWQSNLIPSDIRRPWVVYLEDLESKELHDDRRSERVLKQLEQARAIGPFQAVHKLSVYKKQMQRFRLTSLLALFLGVHNLGWMMF